MRTTVVVIGAGHAGLAMSRCLTEQAIDHVVLERGEVANSWKTERWDTLRLLHGYDHEVDPPQRFEPTRVEALPPLGLDLQRGAILTIIWATGYRPDYTWLNVPVFDHRGRVRHDGGVVESPGMYLIGMPVLRCRRSSFIDGAGNDARYLSAHLASYLANSSTP